MSALASLRCAIYTRVSSDQGLEQDFNSLDAQREAAEAYIRSQAHEGWRLRRERYDDGGFSGGSMERPALQRLLTDVAERRLDIIVVYKVDRLTRSLADFAKLVELFDRRGVSFVSVTQSFNTTSSMGRLTLNVLLSFAQFEREVTGERIRDKIAASKKKGLWMGGVLPLGYRVQDRKLVVDEAEAETVRFIFRRYLELASIPALQRDLRDRGVTSRKRVLATGRTIGGVPLTNGPLSHLLKNRMYIGEINHRGSSYPSDHLPLVDVDLFEAVQSKLVANLNRSDLRKGKSVALLTGCIFDDRDHLMSPTHSAKKGVRYRYYTSSAVVQGRISEAGSIARVAAHEIETIVLAALTERVPELVDNGSDVNAILRKVQLRVILKPTLLDLSWVAPCRSLDDGIIEDEVIDRTRLTVPWVYTPHKRRRDIILPESSSAYVRPIAHSERESLVRSIAQARGWLTEIMEGETIRVIAGREGRTERMIRMVLTLAFLDPALVRAALQGALPRGVSTRRLIDAPVLWHSQWQAVGLSRPDLS